MAGVQQEPWSVRQTQNTPFWSRPAPGVTVEQFAGDGAEVAWFAAEHAVLAPASPATATP
jgi:hypothetical protein